MNLPDLAASSYIALETYRKNGNGSYPGLGNLGR